MKNNVTNETSLESNKKILTIWGNAGAGKSNFATQISILLSQNTNQRILVLDFDTISPSLDHYFDISKEPKGKLEQSKETRENGGLAYIYDSIKRGTFNLKTLKESVIKHPRYDNLDILTGNYSLSLFEAFCEEDFLNIIEEAKRAYDFIIIDTNSVIFIDATFAALRCSDIIYTVIEADYTNIREINKTVSYLSNYIDKQKFEIIVNKYTKRHIDKSTINQALSELEIAEIIDFNEKHINCKIEKKPFILNCNNKEKKPYLNIIEKVIKKESNIIASINREIWFKS